MPFEASVSAAVERVRVEGRVLLVLLSDGSADAEQFDALFADDEVARVVVERFVAVRLVRGSVEAGYFEQMKPQARYPSLCAIHGALDLQELATPPRDAQALLAHLNGLLARVPAQPVPASAPAAPPAAPASPSSAAATAAPAARANEDLQERLRIARERLAQANREREQRRLAEEVEREKARRQEGKALLSTVKEQEEAHRRKAIEERRRKQAEEEEHRRLVKQQIEDDKAERRARREREQQGLPLGSAADAAESASSASASGGDRVGLSIRLLDGSTLKETFAAHDSLASVRAFLDQHLVDQRIGQYAIARLLPTHVFTADEEQQSLGALGLAPSASLVIKARDRTVARAQLSGGVAFAWNSPSTWHIWLLSLLTWLWAKVYDAFRFVYDPPAPPGAAASAPAPPGTTTATRSQAPAKPDTGSSSDVRTLHQRRGKEPARFYNGNSTEYGGDEADSDAQ